MNPLVKNLLAIVAGLFIGGLVNMGLILISGYVIPPPEGADITTTEGLKASMHLFETKHFIFPFLAHALGTLVGATIATKLAATHKYVFALSVGLFFLIGGVVNAISLPSPAWFTALDLIAAYIPMGWLGYRLSK